MNRNKSRRLVIGFCLSLLLLSACGAPAALTSTPIPAAATPVPPTAAPDLPAATPLPVTTNPRCQTIVTLDKKGSELQFGETNIPFNFADFYFEGTVVGEGGLAEVAAGGVEAVTIGEKEVTLTSKDFAEGSIHTEEFGAIKVLTTANIQGPTCILLVATPDQVTKILEWLK